MPQPSPSHHQPHFPRHPSIKSLNGEGEENKSRTRHSPCGSSEYREHKGYVEKARNSQSGNLLFGQFNGEYTLCNVLHSKRTCGMCNFGSTCSSYEHDSSEPEVLVVLPNRSRSINMNTSRHAPLSTSMVISRRQPFPLLEAISRSISGGCPQAYHHLVQSNAIDYRRRSVSSSGIQTRSSFNRLLYHHLLHSWIPRHLPNVIPRSLLSSLEQTFRSDNSHALLLGHASSTSLEAEIGNEAGMRQRYLQMVLFMQMLGIGVSDGSLSLRLTTGRRRQDILVLSNSLSFSTADLPDRHSNMRLDVDSMSYEELLDLEDRIGSVSTGLSEEEVGKFLKHRQYFLFSQENALKETCSICQEEYVEEDKLGSLECGHEFHVNCITQWLTYKNLCPVCRSSALTVFPSNL